jgi:Tol biopolymer transport system component
MMGGRLRRWSGPAALLLSVMAGTADSATAQRVELVSRVHQSPGGAPPSPSTLGSLSADGRFVAFASMADDLVPGQVDRRYEAGDPFTSGNYDVFLLDRATGTTTLISHSRFSQTTGGQFRGDDSYRPEISADGRYTAYVSQRYNLVPGQTLAGRNVFLYDRLLNVTRIVSHRTGAAQEATSGHAINGPLLSADGRFVAYSSDAGNVVNGHNDGSQKILLYDRLTGVNTFVGESDGELGMSADGRFIVFYDRDFQIVLYDRTDGTKTLVSHAAGAPGIPANDQSVYPGISADGNFVVFQSWATDLVPGQIDTYRTIDLFLYDRAADQTVLLSRSAASPVTAANKPSYGPYLSGDGRWITFYSDATDLVTGVKDANNGSDVFLYDRVSRSMTLVSHASNSPNTAANNGSFPQDISGDGRKIAVASQATDLAPGSSGPAGWANLFLYDRDARTSTLLAPTSTRGLPDLWLLNLTPLLSASGGTVAFGSGSALVPGDGNATWDVYVYGGAASRGGPDPFVPCTLLDTRAGGNGPALRSNVRRVLNASAACAVPTTERSVVVQVTVLQASNKGTLRLYPGNVANRPAGSLAFQKNGTVTESFALPLATNGAGTLALLPVMKGNGTIQAVVEISGYYD